MSKINRAALYIDAKVNTLIAYLGTYGELAEDLSAVMDDDLVSDEDRNDRVITITNSFENLRVSVKDFLGSIE